MLENLDIRKITIDVFSYCHGTFNFNENKWYWNGIFTKYPPSEGACQIKSGTEKIIYQGDWKDLPEWFKEVTRTY